MATVGVHGTSQRGSPTFILNNYEYWKKRCNGAGQTEWKCCKCQVLSCPARITTVGLRVVSSVPEHNHEGNCATAMARHAVGQMKTKMRDTVASPSAAQGAVAAALNDHVLMALPKRASLSRVLRRSRQTFNIANGQGAMPPPPTDTFLSSLTDLRTLFCVILVPVLTASLYSEI
jgi:hypothetical protein